MVAQGETIAGPTNRSEMMSRVRARDTEPELVVRRLLHGLGFRFRLHDSRLAGRPDIVLPRRRVVVFVHGCFWHGHDCKKGTTLPKTRREFWTPKLRRNQERDQEIQFRLSQAGWRIVVVWECHLGDRESLARRLKREIEDG